MTLSPSPLSTTLFPANCGHIFNDDPSIYFPPLVQESERAELARLHAAWAQHWGSQRLQGKQHFRAWTKENQSNTVSTTVRAMEEGCIYRGNFWVHTTVLYSTAHFLCSYVHISVSYCILYIDVPTADKVTLTYNCRQKKKNYLRKNMIGSGPGFSSSS